MAIKERPLFRVKKSRIHGTGVFATAAIPKGTRIIEYVGERVSHREADRRYEDRSDDDHHTFLFIVDSRTVIDAGVDGNEARFINHSCAPNCDPIVTKKRVFIESLTAIEAGEELSYDYNLQSDPSVTDDQAFACHCGTRKCRGTMAEEKKKKVKARKPR